MYFYVMFGFSSWCFERSFRKVPYSLFLQLTPIYKKNIKKGDPE
jgi:hypothetical protein